MSAKDGSVSFTAQSTTHTAASFTERSGIVPTDAREIGEPTSPETLLTTLRAELTNDDLAALRAGTASLYGPDGLPRP